MEGSMKKTMWLPVSVLVFLALLPASIIAQTSYALVATFAAPKPVTAAYFGNAVRIGTDRVAVVAPMDKVGETAQAGAAYVFDLSGKLLLSLASPSPKQKAGFGGDQWTSNPLAMDGDLVVVGEALAAGGGRAYAFDRAGSCKAIACTGISPGRQYGCAVAMDGDSIVVAAYNFGAWLFDHSGKQLLSFVPQGVQLARSYGMAVAIRKDLVVVTQDHAVASGIPDAGRAFLFNRKGDTIATIQAPDPVKAAGYGVTAATDGNVVAIGALGAGGDSGTGKVYLYSATGKYLKTLVPPDPASGPGFGIAVAMDSGRIVVGASGASYKGLKGAGRVFIFDTAGNLLSSLASPKPAEYAAFGSSVDIKGDLVLVGAGSEVVADVPDAGRAYLFKVKR
jgi:hypothetical protein